VGGGNGTIFRISPAGTFAFVHIFAPGEGAHPFATLFQNGNGTFYGTTTADGAHGLGTIFSFGLSGGFTNLHSFIRNEGVSPQAAFTPGTNGNLFSVASSGGRFGMGSLFQLSGLSPFIIVAPTNQTVGAGDTVSFTVLAGGSAPFTFQWLFNSNNLANGRATSGARTSILTLTSVTPDNSGFYTVLIQNSAGQILSAAAKLNVIPNPSIHITSPRSGTVVKNQEVTVSGTTSGDAIVARVYYRLNDGAWQLASSSDNWTHWKAIVSAATGTNELNAFAESAIGTYSKTNAVQFFSPPFVPIKGVYIGLFGVPDSFAPASSGFLSLSLNFKGGFSGGIQMAGTRGSFSGQFDSNGDASVTIPRRNQAPLTASLHLELATPDNRITGTLTDGSWVAELLVNRSTFDSHTNAAAVAGHYTFNIPGSSDPTSAPGGDSFGTLTVSTAGKIVASVSLADNTHFAQSVPLTQNGTFPFFAVLYAGKGIILGWLSFTNPAASVLGGEVNWYKPTAPSKYYPDGFTISSDASGDLYEPTNATGVLNATNAQIVLIGGDLSDTITNLFTFDSHNRVTDLSGNHLTLSFSSSTGTFKGSLIEPGSGRKLPFFGVMREDFGIGDGFFLGTSLSGNALLGP
ncbi:MAG TPA: choice-of-anchor tandem repeat GloVer-containing protein, partial [Terriglobia bacterium]|nr:choice-of-anchor tandem repeat GloVer-containing protein [Terriglobia bacterium]